MSTKEQKEDVIEVAGGILGVLVVLGLIIGIEMLLALALSDAVPSFAPSSHPGILACFLVTTGLTAIIGGAVRFIGNAR